MKQIYGDLENVLLTEKEFEKLENRFGAEVFEKINDLSYYIGSKGDSYKSHYNTILNWARRDAKKLTRTNSFNNFKQKSTSYDEIRRASLARLLEGGNSK